MINSIELIIPGREVSLGDGFGVKRVLPYSQRRMVGPFIFWDHMGPHLFNKGLGLEVNSHPHIGLSTLTYLLEGRIMHRDSLGNEVIIRPGEVNWMTSGHGVTHSERSVPEDMAGEHRLHGLQLWVALPDDQEDRAPSFTHVESGKIPEVVLGSMRCRLVAGTARGKTSPVPAYSPMFFIDVDAQAGEEFQFDPDGGEIAVYLTSGEIFLGAQKLSVGQMAVLKAGEALAFTARQKARAFVFGGAPFPTPRHIWWNFVSSSKQKIEAAKKRWEEDRFPAVFNESPYSRVPLPKA